MAERGRGAPVVLVHGVAFGPGTLMPVAEAIAGGGARALVPHRRGYGRSAGLPALDDPRAHAGDIAAALHRAGVARAVWVGVGEGAAIALAAAIHHPGRVVAAVLHEPGLGPLTPGLQRRLAGEADRAGAAPTPELGAAALGRALAGLRTWQTLPPRVRAGVYADARAATREARLLTAGAAGLGDLHGLRARRVVASAGVRSSRARRDAAGLLASRAGARAVTTRSGHLVQVEAPGELARLALATAMGRA